MSNFTDTKRFPSHHQLRVRVEVTHDNRRTLYGIIRQLAQARQQCTQIDL
jgi:hypothetical protein